MSDAGPRGRCLGRRLVGGGLALCAVAAAVGTSPEAGAFGSTSAGAHAPLELRVAVAAGAQRTVVWSQLRVDAAEAPFAVIVPAAPGAVLDWSSDAWMEALEEATAPVVLPPDGLEPVCPGEPEDPDRAHLLGREHAPTVTPLEVVELADGPALATWAGQHGMVASSALYDALNATAGPFVAARFSGTGGATLTPTLRIVRPGSSTALPFVLSEATSEPVDIALFALGPGRPQLDGPQVTIPWQHLTFDVAEGSSNYETRRDAALFSPSNWLLECSSHARLDEPLDITPGRSLASLVGGYFIRGTAYEPVGTSANACFALAHSAMQATSALGTACPSGAIGTVGDTPSNCVETGALSELRCGLGQDSPLSDLALALSEQTPEDMVLSRIAMRIGAGEVGSTTNVSFANASFHSPVIEAGALDFEGCPGGEPSSSSSSGVGGGPGSSGAGAAPGSSGAGGRTRRVPVYGGSGSSCGSRGDVGAPVFYTDVDDTDDAPDAYYTDGDGDCGGDTFEVYDSDGDGVTDDVGDYSGDDCGSDTYESDTYESDYDNDDCGGDTYEDDGYEGDDCGGDSSEGYEWEDYDCSGDSSDGYEWEDDDCSGDSSDGYEADDCGGDTSDSSADCDAGDTSSSDSCSISRGRRKRPRMSAITLSLVALLFPVRRWRRPRRRRKRRVKRG